MSEGWGQIFFHAITLLLAFDADLYSIIFVSFSVSLLALVITLVPSILLGFSLAFARFKGRWLLTTIIQTLQSIPTVVIGLLVYILLTRQGPFGDLQWLFTQKAMILGQMLICIPILVSLSQAAFTHIDRRGWETSRTLGRSSTATLLLCCRELKVPLLLTVVTAFSRIITEVGCSMMVGGNILNATRNIPTAIALETNKGEFSQAIALGMVLLLLSLTLNLCLAALRGNAMIRSY
ncbi:ABC transporter permease [Thalassotalea ponticola]|uniref:ABC transporter permease n=1 Tax=Thalassotalea ponticola TaxID=1523392 RepID=UPI0025B4CB61|nr:ABC transporter permease [Thalassotalea ponticola]MDN3653974.1 ABC transporter permease [Thalassotalea ponticola]